MSQVMIKDDGILNLLKSDRPYLWINPSLTNQYSAIRELPLTLADVYEAEQRLLRFAPLLRMFFPELQETEGIIESELLEVPLMLAQLNQEAGGVIDGRLWLKADHNLPVAGSVKARGGIYEVLCYAEDLAFQKGLLKPGGDYRVLATAEAMQLFEEYTIAVGSTGNLGLSIGVMASAMGFQACVHMSIEAKAWKKERLRKLGVVVVEHAEDYSKAVASGRATAERDPYVYFVDDENSERLFLGYSVAALRLEQQLRTAGIVVDDDNPLFVYIPCGVGGAPGGITFGLKQVYGNAVHCFFAEPTQAPCMLLGMSTQFQDDLSVYDIGLNLDTDADGLAVSQASELVGTLMKPLLSGIFTVEDQQMFRSLYQLKASESVQIEPSAAAGFSGPGLLLGSDQGCKYLRDNGLESKMSQSNHVVWTTGGRFVPDAEYSNFQARGRSLCCAE